MLPQTLLRSSSASAVAQGALGLVANALRGISSSVCAQQQGTPSYTYTPPGSSIQDPTYAGAGLPHSKSGAPLPDAKIARPSKKAQWLRLSTKHARELESQSQQPGAMLPPGCSMSDPHYSIRDPVYFHDKQ